MGDLLNLFGLSAGVVLYAMLLMMVMRAPQGAGAPGARNRLPLATAILGLIWNICALPLVGLPTVGIGAAAPYVSILGFAALGFLPAVVVHSVLKSGARRIDEAATRLLIATPYVASALATVLHVRSFASGGPVPAVAAMRLLTYTYVALVVPVAFVARRQPGARRALWVAALSVFAVSAWHLTQLHTGQDPWPVELLGHHASLPLALAILYQDYPFAFADLFLKRALMLLALVAVVFIVIATIGLPSTARATAVLIGPRDVAIIVTLWILTALSYPYLHRGVSWFVDTIVLRRPDYRVLRSTIAKRAEAHGDIALLLDEICTRLMPAISADSVRWREVSELTAHDEAGLGSIVYVADGSTTVMVPTSDAPYYCIVAGRLTGGRRLFSDDISMLETVAVTIARRIDAIRLSDERHDRELREQEIGKLATEAELRALRAQINPHFLFNALTTIGYLIQAAPARALDTLMRLTTLLRSVLRSQGEFTTLGQELKIVESYLDIERARFEDRLRVHIDVPESLRSVRVPPLILQPLVENAVKHGISPQRVGGEVTVSAKLAPADAHDQRMVLGVADTGAGVTADTLAERRGQGLGLSNVERRLACQYGDHASLDIRSSPGRGTVVEIRVPVTAWIDEATITLGGIE